MQDDKVKHSVDLDSIMVEEIGQFGKYQLKTLLLCASIISFSSLNGEYIFTAGRIPTRCFIPECDTTDPEFSPSWLLDAIPGESLSSFDNCHRYSYNNFSMHQLSQQCPSELFDRNQIVPCETYLYENTNTIVYDYDLACKEWLRSFVGTARTIGTFAALPITGYISDRWGRRTSLLFNSINIIWIGILRYWATTYTQFTVSQFVESVLGAGGFPCAYILLMELVGPKYRLACGAIMNTSFALGQVLLGVLAWAFPNWRTLTLVIYIPMLIFISYRWLMSESIRWQMSRGDFTKFEKTLKNVARVNGKTLSDISIKALREAAELEQKNKEIKDAERAKQPFLIILVFRYKSVLFRCMVIPIWWITMTMVYYGLSINAVNLSGNPYVNYMAVSAVEIPGFWLAFLLLDRLGRRPVLMGGLWICAICQFAYILLPSDMETLSLVLFLVGKLFIATVVTSLYIYTAELYPTMYRNNLVAFSSMLGRIGSIVAPLTPALGHTVWEPAPFALFGVFSLLSGTLVYLTPETKGTKLPDTMEEANNLGL